MVGATRGCEGVWYRYAADCLLSVTKTLQEGLVEGQQGHDVDLRSFQTRYISWSSRVGQCQEPVVTESMGSKAIEKMVKARKPMAELRRLVEAACGLS